MDNLKKVLVKLMAEGKTNAEISQEVPGMEEAKGLDVKALALAIEEARKSNDLEVELSKIEAEKAAKAEKDEQTKVLKEEILKSININPTQNFKPTKRFDITQGKEVELTNHEEKSLNAANNLFKAIASGDNASAKAISKEIDEDNSRYGRKDSRSDDSATGGYAVPTMVHDKVIQFAYDKSVMLENASKIVVTGEDMTIPTMGTVTASYITNQETELSEQNPTFGGPSLPMKRVGLFSNISNTFISQRGDIVSEFIQAYGSAMHRFIDLHMAVGSVDGNSDLLDGMVFQSLTNLETAVALTDLDVSDLLTMIATISDEADQDSLRFIGNRKVMHQIATMTDAGSGYNYTFNEYLKGGTVKIAGIPYVLNTKIPSTLDVGGDKRTTGTDDVLILADMSKTKVGVGANMRIDTSSHYNFTTDQLSIRGIQRIGWVSTLAACEALELTN